MPHTIETNLREVFSDVIAMQRAKDDVARVTEMAETVSNHYIQLANQILILGNPRENIQLASDNIWSAILSGSRTDTSGVRYFTSNDGRVIAQEVSKIAHVAIEGLSASSLVFPVRASGVVRAGEGPEFRR